MKKTFGKKALVVLLIALMVPGTFMACSNGTTKKETVTKDVSVGFPAYTSGQTSISFAPTYAPDGGWGEHFGPSDITYTVTCEELGKTYDGSNSFTAKISDGYSNFITYTFTQTFKMGNTVIGSQVIKIEVMGGGFGVLKNAGGTNLSPQVIPPVNLTLCKEVEK